MPLAMSSFIRVRLENKYRGNAAIVQQKTNFGSSIIEQLYYYDLFYGDLLKGGSMRMFLNFF